MFNDFDLLSFIPFPAMYVADPIGAVCVLSFCPIGLFYLLMAGAYLNNLIFSIPLLSYAYCKVSHFILMNPNKVHILFIIFYWLIIVSYAFYFIEPPVLYARTLTPIQDCMPDYKVFTHLYIKNYHSQSLQFILTSDQIKSIVENWASNNSILCPNKHSKILYAINTLRDPTDQIMLLDPSNFNSHLVTFNKNCALWANSENVTPAVSNELHRLFSKIYYRPFDAATISNRYFCDNYFKNFTLPNSEASSSSDLVKSYVPYNSCTGDLIKQFVNLDNYFTEFLRNPSNSGPLTLSRYQVAQETNQRTIKEIRNYFYSNYTADCLKAKLKVSSKFPINGTYTTICPNCSPAK